MEKGKQIIKLPKGWIKVKLEDISKQITDGSHNPPKSVDSGIPMLSARNIHNSNITFDKVRYIAKEKFEYENQRTKIEKGDVLLTIVATIGRTAVVSKNIKSIFTLQRSVAAIKPLINSYFLMYCFQSPLFQKLLNDNAKGTAQKGIYLRTLRSLEIPLAPIKEQERIVSKIETLFSELNQAETGLQKSKYQLEIYKSAILKQAFEGKLTEQWRNEHNPKSSKELIKHINEERQKNYEQEVFDWKEALNKWNKENKIVKKPRKPFFVKLIPLSKDINVDNWFMGSFLNTVRNYDGDRIALSKTVREFRKGKYPYYGATEIVDYVDNFIFDGKYLLIGEDGANLLSKAKKLAFIASGKFWVNNHAHVVQPLFGIRIEYLAYYFNSLILNEYITGTAQPKLNQTNLNRIPVPYCCDDEQEKIIEILESRFTLIENLEKSINNSLNDTIILKHSILKKAFDGKLVNQDSNDESARELLMRIKMKKEIYLEAQKELDKLKPKKKRQMETKKTVLEILKENNEPILAKELWQKSIHKNDIEEFYLELKGIYHLLDEVKKDTKSLLSLKR